MNLLLLQLPRYHGDNIKALPDYNELTKFYYSVMACFLMLASMQNEWFEFVIGSVKVQLTDYIST